MEASAVVAHLLRSGQLLATEVQRLESESAAGCRALWPTFSARPTLARSSTGTHRALKTFA